MTIRTVLAASAFTASAALLPGQTLTFDILDKDPDAGDYFRAFGFNNNGQFGVPVAGGHDMDGDDSADSAIAYMLSSVGPTSDAGRVALVFGTGVLEGEVDTAIKSSRVLHVVGAQTDELAGSEIWMDDVTGDGLGDLLVCRQNYTPGWPATGRLGAGALSIIVGTPNLRTIATSEADYELENPPGNVSQVTFHGREQYNRLGIWIRTGDVDGDGISDIAVGMDQSDVRGVHSGEVYVIRGGDHLNTTQTIDLMDFGSTALEGHIARILPPENPDFPEPQQGGERQSEYHLGSTLHIGDIDGNGRGEVLMAAGALNRSGATLRPSGGNSSETHGSSQDRPFGAPSNVGDGTIFIAWDDNFPTAPWPNGFTVDMASPTGSITTIDGPSGHGSFGEEIVVFDLDGNEIKEVMGSDLVFNSARGQAIVLYDAANLKGLDVDLDNTQAFPQGSRQTTINGPSAGSIGLDTVMIGDFDGDGFDELASGNPQDNPNGRTNAGTIHVMYGKEQGWPAVINLAPGQLPASEDVRIALIQGRFGNDILAYSASYGDMDGDGRTDIIVNEMTGDSPSGNNVGNLVLISGAKLLPPPMIDTDVFVFD